MRILRAKLVTARPSVIPPIVVPLGMPAGVINSAWSDPDSRSAGTEFATTSEQGIAAGPSSDPPIIKRVNAAKALGVQLILPLTGGAHTSYLTDFGDGATLNPRFDRTKYTVRLQSYNTPAILSVLRAEADLTVAGYDVMDEPFNTGGADGNTWGPTGAMVKVGPTNPTTLQMWGVVVGAAGALVNATSIPLTTGLAKAIPAGTRLTFLPGSGKECITNGIQAQGAGSLNVQPIPTALTSGNHSYSNSCDNMAQEVKNMLLPAVVAVGVTHSNHLFGAATGAGGHYISADFMIAQFVWRYAHLASGYGPFNSIEAYRDDNLAEAAAAGHNIVFSMNLLNGGERISGCPVPATGGVGTFGVNCRMRPDQILEFSRALCAQNGLGQQGRGQLMWRYDSAFFVSTVAGDLASQNQASFATMMAEMALRPKLLLRRGT